MRRFFKSWEQWGVLWTGWQREGRATREIQWAALLSPSRMIREVVRFAAQAEPRSLLHAFQSGQRAIGGLRQALLLTVLVPTAGYGGQPQEWPDPGLSAARDLFPLNLISIPYIPLRAVPIGHGEWQASLQVARSNTFEFSNLIKREMEAGTPSRVMVDRDGAERFARDHPGEPLIYYFDMEEQRAALTIRTGITPSTDLAFSVGWQGASGGWLDGVIEGFHQLGFRQRGRENIVRNQVSVVVIQKGRVVAFSANSTRAHSEDPVLSILQRIVDRETWTISLSGNLKIPLTRWNGVYRSDWDASLNLLGQWRTSERHIFDLGFGYLRRGLKDDGPSPFFLKDQVAGHLGWEWRQWPRIRPYILLVGTSGLASAEPGSNLQKPAFIHDLGFHYRLGRRSSMTLGYINNFSHNENTADMGVILRFSLQLPAF